MRYPNPIAARSWRGRFPGAKGAPRPRLTGGYASLFMLAALAIRLASMMPGVPVLHWHGSVAMVHPGGGIPHDFGTGACGHGDTRSEEDGSAPGQTYYSPADIPLQPAGAPAHLPMEVALQGVNGATPDVWRGPGALSPGPSRAPPQHGPETAPIPRPI